jgi:imidazoleglycerol phosphate synthase glutamine amidotransferase subunit HisH
MTERCVTRRGRSSGITVGMQLMRRGGKDVDRLGSNWIAGDVERRSRRANGT